MQPYSPNRSHVMKCSLPNRMVSVCYGGRMDCRIGSHLGPGPAGPAGNLSIYVYEPMWGEGDIRILRIFRIRCRPSLRLTYNCPNVFSDFIPEGPTGREVGDSIRAVISESTRRYAKYAKYAKYANDHVFGFALNYGHCPCGSVTE